MCVILCNLLEVGLAFKNIDEAVCCSSNFVAWLACDNNCANEQWVWCRALLCGHEDVVTVVRRIEVWTYNFIYGSLLQTNLDILGIWVCSPQQVVVFEFTSGCAYNSFVLFVATLEWLGVFVHLWKKLALVALAGSYLYADVLDVACILHLLVEIILVLFVVVLNFLVADVYQWVCNRCVGEWYNFEVICIVIEIEVLVCENWVCNSCVLNQLYLLVCKSLELYSLLHILPAAVKCSKVLVVLATFLHHLVVWCNYGIEVVCAETVFCSEWVVVAVQVVAAVVVEDVHNLLVCNSDAKLFGLSFCYFQLCKNVPCFLFDVSELIFSEWSVTLFFRQSWIDHSEHSLCVFTLFVQFFKIHSWKLLVVDCADGSLHWVGLE